MRTPPEMKNILFLLSLFLLFSCIKAYDPEIDEASGNKYVVSGRIVNAEGWQEVEVSLSSPFQSPDYITVSGCQVTVTDQKGHVFTMEEYSPGHYLTWMGDEYVVPGNAYRVRVLTPDNQELVSGFDQMPKGPSLDSVYYSVNEVPAPNSQTPRKIMQFYVDLNAVGDDSHFYKWEIEETWEYHSAHAAEFYYDGIIHQIAPPDSSNMICWATGPVKNVFTLSTKGLSQNGYTQFPLHNVDEHSSRLTVLYSMLVSQLALSEEAYNYWEQMRINSNEQGGLYEKQPLAIKGNLINLTNPENVVLGYFFAASVSSGRYFYHDVEGMSKGFNACYEEDLPVFGFRSFFPWEYPVWFYYNAGMIKILYTGCVDCRQLGGTKTKPDFWPN